MWSELAKSFQENNIYLWMMMVGFFIAVTVIIERFIMLTLVFNINFGKFLSNLKKMISSEDFERAMNLCRSASRTSLPKISLAALEAAENDPTTVRGTIEEETIAFLPRIEARISLLPNMATLIMLIGILSTIDALWSSFHAVDILDTAKKQTIIARSIASSLNPTALGLIGCMIILFFHQILRGSALRIAEQIHQGVTVLSNLLIPSEITYIAQGAAKSADDSLHADTHTAENGAAGAAEEGVQGEDAFDDASVEDIKDEEEII